MLSFVKWGAPEQHKFESEIIRINQIAHCQKRPHWTNELDITLLGDKRDWHVYPMPRVLQIMSNRANPFK